MSPIQTPTGRPRRPAGRWRARIGGYLAALILNAAIVGTAPGGALTRRPGIERLAAGRDDRFDPRELCGPGVVVTLPLGPGRVRCQSPWFGPN